MLRNAIAALESLPDWAPVYFDGAFVVYVQRDRETRERVDALAIDWEHPVHREATPPAFATPADWLAGVFPRVPDSSALANQGYLLLLVGSLQRASEAFAEAVRLRPDDAWSRLHLAILQHALGRREAAREELARIEPALLESPEVLALRSHLARRQGQPEEAFEFLRRAVAAGDRSPARTRELELLARELPDPAAARAALEELAAAQAGH
jgi:tetratricopeptide (TPR) repeat protein